MKTFKTILTSITITLSTCIVSPTLSFAQDHNDWQECHHPMDALKTMISYETSQAALHGIMDDAEVIYELNRESLMIVYSDLLEEEDDLIEFLEYGIHDFSGNRFTMTSEITEVNTPFAFRADYTGQLGGNPLLMSQYVMPGIPGEMRLFRIISANQKSHFQANNAANQILDLYTAPDRQELARCDDR